MLRSIAILALTLCASACEADHDHATRVLNSAGYKHVMLRGYPFWSCSDDDKFNIAFSALGANNQVVTGAVCCGWMKNCTIRLD